MHINYHIVKKANKVSFGCCRNTKRIILIYNYQYQYLHEIVATITNDDRCTCHRTMNVSCYLVYVCRRKWTKRVQIFYPHGMYEDEKNVCTIVAWTANHAGFMYQYVNSFANTLYVVWYEFITASTYFTLWIIVCSVPKHYLNQCWIIINLTPNIKFQWNYNNFY